MALGVFGLDLYYPSSSPATAFFIKDNFYGISLELSIINTLCMSFTPPLTTRKTTDSRRNVLVKSWQWAITRMKYLPRYKTIFGIYEIECQVLCA